MGKFIERIENGKRKYLGPGFEPRNRDYHGVFVHWQELCTHVWVCTRRKVMNSCIKEWGYYVVISWWNPTVKSERVDLTPNTEIEVQDEDTEMDETARALLKEIDNFLEKYRDDNDELTDEEIAEDGGCGYPNCDICYPDGIGAPCCDDVDCELCGNSGEDEEPRVSKDVPPDGRDDHSVR